MNKLAERRRRELSPVELAAEAQALGLDPSAIAPADLLPAVQAEKARRWREENAEALQAQEDRLVEHGHPLAAYVDPDNPLKPFMGPGPHWRQN